MFGIKKSIYSTSVVNVNTKITGTLITEGEIEIYGIMDGNIVCDKVVVGLSGLVNGEITAQKVIINGTVTGDIHASSIFFGKTAQVKGNMYHNFISIATGANIEGDLRKKKKQQDKIKK